MVLAYECTSHFNAEIQISPVLIHSALLMQASSIVRTPACSFHLIVIFNTRLYALNTKSQLSSVKVRYDN
jgi:hypothetical protein